MEVYQLATYFGRRLNLNIPAVEAIALGHDTGHTPFGHAGEAALNDLLRDFGGFHHAAHSVRSLDRIAYDPHTLEEEDTSGLNLTWAVREGIFKHGWYNPPSTPYHKPPLVTLEWDLDSYRSYGSAEAQAVALADQIAYLNHDLDDLLIYGFDKILSPKTIAVFFEKQTAKSRAPGSYSNWNTAAQQFLTLLKVDEPNRVKLLVRDAVNASVERVKQALAGTLDPMRERLIEFSPELRDTRNLFYEFFNECVYSDVRIQHKNKKGKDIVVFLYDFFERFFNGNRDLLPIHMQDELAAHPPWWQTYLAAIAPKPSKRNHPKPALVENGSIACKYAAADVVADLTDHEALAAARALDEAESTAGMEVIDRVLSTFPNRQQFDSKQRRQLETRQELRALFPVAGN